MQFIKSQTKASLQQAQRTIVHKNCLNWKN